MYTPDETIVAQSSPSASGGLRGIIRISGVESFTITAKQFTPTNHKSFAAFSKQWEPISGLWQLDNNIQIPCICFCFSAPKSYTTENMVEINIPGSPLLAQWIIETLLAAGCRMAHRGEFTARAFFNGRIDLTQAEAVAQLIHAQSDQQLRAAEKLMAGDLFTKTDQIATTVSELLALVEADIDFSEEDIPFASLGQLENILNPIISTLRVLIAQSTSWDKINHMPRVILAGLANGGKSTLVNNLTKMDRAICSDIAGTTRDILSTPLKLNHGECLLIDTAGFGDVLDPLAMQTQTMSNTALSNCDLLLYVVDITGTSAQLRNSLEHYQAISTTVESILIINKCDLFTGDIAQKCASIGRTFSAAHISVSGIKDDLTEMKSYISNKLSLVTLSTSQDNIALSSRQRNALSAATTSLENGAALIKDPANCEHEFLALDLREALEHLGEVSGKVVADDILGIIFGKFCIGK